MPNFFDTTQVLYLRLDTKRPDGNVPDISTYKQNASVQGQPSLKSDPDLGFVLSLDGQSDAVKVDHSSDLNFYADFSASLWFCPEIAIPQQGSGVLPLISKGDLQGTVPFMLGIDPNDSSLEFKIREDNGTMHTCKSEALQLHTGEWHHVCVSFASGVLKMYLGGRELSVNVPAGMPGQLPQSSHDLYVGATQNGAYFQASFSQLRVFSAPSLPEDILQIIAKDWDPTVLHLPMDELSGGVDLSVQRHEKDGGTLSLEPDEDFGKVAHFRGEDGLALVPSMSLNPGNGLCLSAFVKLDKEPKDMQALRPPILSKWQTGDLEGFFFGFDKGKNALAFSFELAKDQSMHVAGGNKNSWEPGRWYHVAVSYRIDTGEVNFWVDGSLDAQKSLNTGEMDVFLGLVEVGSYTGESLEGSLAHVRMLRQPLGQEKLKELIQMDRLGLRAEIDFDYEQSRKGFFENDRVLAFNPHGAQTVHDPQLGAVLRLSGSEKLSLLPAAALGLTQRSFTVEAWVKPGKDEQYDLSILGTAGETLNHGLHLVVRGMKAYMGFFNNDTGGQQSLEVGKWYYLAWSYDKDTETQRVWVNAQVDQSATGKAAFEGEDMVSIGSWRGGNYFEGDLGHIRIFSHLRSGDEMQAQMKEDLNSLVLHMPLSQSDQGKVPSVEGKLPTQGTLQGGPSFVPDTAFGSVLELNGTDQWVSIPDEASLQFEHDFAVSIWVKLDAQPASNYVRVLGKGASNQRNYGLWYHFPDKKWLFQVQDAQTMHNLEYVASAIETEHWYHLCGVREGDQLRLYLDGSLVQETSIGSQSLVSSTDPLTIGFAGFDLHHKGQLAHARIFERSLPAEEIAAWHQLDRNSVSAFIHSEPIDFRLANEEDLEILYIQEGGVGQEMRLALTNRSAYDITFGDVGSDAASGSSHHIELQFRPGTLSTALLGALGSEDQLDWTFGKNGHPSGFHSLYLKKIKDRTLAAGDTWYVTLQGLGAGSRGGTRESRVELRYGNMAYVGEGLPVFGSRTRGLSILPTREMRQTPLYLTSAGQIASKSTNNAAYAVESTILLRLGMPGSQGGVKINPKSDPRPTRFVLSFFVEEGAPTDPWAVAKKDEVLGAQVAVNGWDVTRVTGKPQWIIEHPTKTLLAAGENLEIVLSHFRSSLPSGEALLQVAYYDLPGYMDGVLSTQVRRSGLVEDAQGRILIGDVSPHKQLNVAGGIYAEGGMELVGDLETGGLQLGSGPMFKEFRAGSVKLGPGGNGTYHLDVQIGPFQHQPMGMAIARCTDNVTDTFAVTVQRIDKQVMRLNVNRVDLINDPWGQELYIDWFAWSL